MRLVEVRPRRKPCGDGEMRTDLSWALGHKSVVMKANLVAESLAQRLTKCGFPTKRRVSGMGVTEDLKKWKWWGKKKERKKRKRNAVVVYVGGGEKKGKKKIIIIIK